MDQFMITSRAFTDGGWIPARHTDRGEDLSPELQLHGIDPDAKSIAITLNDASHPLFPNYSHWVIWNIPVREVIPEGIPQGKTVAGLGGAVQGVAYGRNRYRGPKPPLLAVHTYVFTVYVLDCMLKLGSSAGKRELLNAMDAHILQKARLTGRFQNGWKETPAPAKVKPGPLSKEQRPGKAQTKLENPIRIEELSPAKTLQRIGFPGGAVLCDLGAGSGIFTIPAARLTRNKVYALEKNEELLSVIRDKAQAEKLSNIEAVKVDGDGLPLEGGSADLVLMATVLHEIDDKTALLNEVRRVLKPGGRVAILEFHKRATPMGPPVDRRLAREELGPLFEGIGFHRTDQFDLGENFYCAVFAAGLPRLTGLSCILPCDDLRRTGDFYEEKLGFRQVRYLDSAEPHICLYRDETELILTLARESSFVPNHVRYGYGYDLCFYTGRQEALQMEFRDRGVKIVRELSVTDYQNHEFVIEDPDGRWVAFGRKYAPIGTRREKRT